MKIIAENKKALFDFSIVKEYESGIVLTGSEAKAIRANRINLKGSFIKIVKGEAWLLNTHISVLTNISIHDEHEPERQRKLLLSKRQIMFLHSETEGTGVSIVPLSVYITSKNLIKLKIALVKGKKLFDKRASEKEKQIKLDILKTSKEY